MRAKNLNGITLKDYRSGFGRDHIIYGFANSPLGWVLTGWYEDALCFFNFAQKDDDIIAIAKLQMLWPYNEIIQDDIRAQRLVSHIFQNGELDISCNQTLPILLKGRPFQLKVWQELLCLKPLELVTYGEMARRIQIPGAARAVGSALNKNPINLIVPCHRVMANDGKGGFSMGGFAHGIEMKQEILKLEKAI